jgi:hypothetical protein
VSSWHFTPDDAAMRNVPAPDYVRPNQIQFCQTRRFAEQSPDKSDSSVRIETLLALSDLVHHSPVGFAVPHCFS